MSEMKLVVPTLFGLEGLAGDELRRLNMENVRVEDRRVFFTGDEAALARREERDEVRERPLEAPQAGGRLPLADEGGTDADHAHARRVALDAVQDPLGVRLLP